MKTVCAWCRKLLLDGPPDPVSHGLCIDCYAAHWSGPLGVFSVADLAALDSLPYGVAEIAPGSMMVLTFAPDDSAPSALGPDLVGRDYFLEVAPWAFISEVSTWVAAANSATPPSPLSVRFLISCPQARRLVGLRLECRKAPQHLTLNVRCEALCTEVRNPAEGE